VTPVSASVGTWKKWVSENQLFTVSGDDE